ncbi:MAG TPA: TetR/AcrR family transcriptional regulator [Usitatibacter sp.]|nr:TetR/AcrR family transcriptional regulator [Usitatibacter sp.]
MTVFWQKGYEAASLQDLTEAMGISPPSLYAAFGDKEGLFVAAVKRYHAQAKAMGTGCQEAATARDSVEGLLTLAANFFTDPQHPRGCFSVMAMTTAASTSERVQQILCEERAAAKERLRGRIQRGIREGELPPDTDATALANLYGAVLAGMSLQAREGASRKALLAMVETAMRAWPEAPKRAGARRERARA